MAFAWQTLEEAAVSMGVSIRTLHRRVSRGEMQTRLENGRREILVTLPEGDGVWPSATPSATGDSQAYAGPTVVTATPTATVSEVADVADATEARQTTLALAEDRLRRADLAIAAFQQTLTYAAAEARRARKGSVIAWSSLGGMAVVLIIAAIWATHRVTSASADVRQARQDLATVSQQMKAVADTADTARQEADRLRQVAQTAEVKAAKAEGGLATILAAPDARQTTSATTQPADLPPTTQARGVFTSILDMFRE